MMLLLAGEDAVVVGRVSCVHRQQGDAVVFGRVGLLLSSMGEVVFVVSREGAVIIGRRG